MLEQFPLTHMHAFTYSKRDGTPSASMKPEIKGDIAKARLKSIEALIAHKNFLFRQKNHAKPLEILIEEEKKGIFSGYDQFFNKINIHSSRDLLKEWVHISTYEVQKETNVAHF